MFRGLVQTLLLLLQRCSLVKLATTVPLVVGATQGTVDDESCSVSPAHLQELEWHLLDWREGATIPLLAWSQ